MGTVLNRAALGAAAAILSHAALADDASDRHQWQVEIDAGYVAADSDLGPWTEGGLGKLRYAESNDGFISARLFAQYRGRISPTLTATVIGDYLDDASSGVDLSEAFIDWRPIPKSSNQQQVRFGAFYPPLSLENTELGWHSPFTYSYSAINTWLGEEIRPIGAEWSLRRRLGFAGSPHELRAFAGAFYGNDPAGTLLCSGAGGRCMIARRASATDCRCRRSPPGTGPATIVGYTPQSVEPFEEIDHEPGAYVGAEWRYAKRVLVQVARYDNRADPYSFADGQWGWGTAFTHVGVQASLPGQIGLDRAVDERRHRLDRGRGLDRLALRLRRARARTSSTRGSSCSRGSCMARIACPCATTSSRCTETGPSRASTPTTDTLGHSAIVTSARSSSAAASNGSRSTRIGTSGRSTRRFSTRPSGNCACRSPTVYAHRAARRPRRSARFRIPLSPQKALSTNSVDNTVENDLKVFVRPSSALASY